MASVHSDGKSYKSQVGKTIFEYADFLNIRVPTACGRTGECHECIVEIRSGLESLSPLNESESFLRGNYRLACQATVVSDNNDIEFATLRRQPKILTDSISRNVELDPSATRIGNSVYIDNKEVSNLRNGIYGLAGDIGTTTIVLNIVDLQTGGIVLTSSFENPQRFGGSDVMNRISYDGNDNTGELQQVMLSSINFEIGEMVKELAIHRRDIFDVVLVGNTTMRDILFGINTQPIGEKPYKSKIQTEYESGTRCSTSLKVTAEELGLRVFPKAQVYSGPLVSCHIGSDVAADMLATGFDESETPIMLVDVGTNTEVIIGNKDRMFAASCPAGPAFEGGEVTYGMPGYDGAVESVKINNGKPKISTIGNAPVEGICGSGLVDLLAELKKSDIMNELGVLKNQEDQYYFAPDDDMALDRSDISALAQAKSANYCGQYIAMRTSEHNADDISVLYLAGGFANYIDAENAKAIGFIANFDSQKIVKAGNASLHGATLMLVSKTLREKIEALVKKVAHIELETTPDFFDIFVEGCMFKPMPTSIHN